MFTVIHSRQLTKNLGTWQEVLRAYGSSAPSSTAPSGTESVTRASQQDNALYAALGSDVQRLVAPYLSSCYELVSRGPGRVPQGTVFGSGGSPASYREWLSQWLRQLVQHHAGGEPASPGCLRPEP